jgi:hypothetical protein
MVQKLSKLEMTLLNMAQALAVLSIHTAHLEIFPNNRDLPNLSKVRIARLPVHLVPSMERMRPTLRAPGEMRVYLRPSIEAPEQLPPSLVPVPDQNQPTIRLAPPSTDLNKSPIKLSPPTIIPQQMPIQLEAPSTPPETPIRLTPSNFEYPSYPFPTITAPK